jgi:hypothetical protein
MRTIRNAFDYKFIVSISIGLIVLYCSEEYKLIKAVSASLFSGFIWIYVVKVQNLHRRK